MLGWPGTPLTASTRPPRKGPSIRQCRPEYSCGLYFGCWATSPGAARARATRTRDHTYREARIRARNIWGLLRSTTDSRRIHEPGGRSTIDESLDGEPLGLEHRDGLVDESGFLVWLQLDFRGDGRDIRRGSIGMEDAGGLAFSRSQSIAQRVDRHARRDVANVFDDLEPVLEVDGVTRAIGEQLLAHLKRAL